MLVPIPYTCVHFSLQLTGIEWAQFIDRMQFQFPDLILLSTSAFDTPIFWILFVDKNNALHSKKFVSATKMIYCKILTAIVDIYTLRQAVTPKMSAVKTRFNHVSV